MRPPQEAPEQGRDDHREGREPGGVAVEQRLDHLPEHRLGDQEQRRGLDHHRPARIDRGGQDHRADPGREGADIGDEAHQRREHAPQERVGHADDPEPDADEHAEGGVHAELGEEVGAEPARGVVHRHRRAVQVARPEQADHAVAQVLALHQQEHDDHQHDADRGQRLDDRAQHLLGEHQRRGLGLLHPHELRLGGVVARRGRRDGAGGVGLPGGGGDVVTEALQQPVRLPEPALLEPRELPLHGGLILRQVAGQPRHLRADDRADAADHPEGEQDRDDHRGDAPEAQPAQQVDDRSQDEAEQHRQHEGDEHLAPEVEGGHEDDPDREGQEAAQAGHEGWRHLRRLSWGGARLGSHGYSGTDARTAHAHGQPRGSPVWSAPDAAAALRKRDGARSSLDRAPLPFLRPAPRRRPDPVAGRFRPPRPPRRRRPGWSPDRPPRRPAGRRSP